MAKIPPNTSAQQPSHYYQSWTELSTGLEHVVYDMHSTVTTGYSRHVYQADETPNFFKRKAAGEFLPPLMYLRHDEDVVDSFSYELQSSVYGGSPAKQWTREVARLTTSPWSGDTAIHRALHDSICSADLASLMNQATGRLNKNADIGPFLAGLNQARRMVLQLLKRLASFLSDVAAKVLLNGRIVLSVVEVISDAIRGGVAHAKTLPKGVAGLYLEIIYGWRPLLDDIKTIYEQLRRIAKGEDNLPKLIRAQAESTTAEMVDFVVSGELWPGMVWHGQKLYTDLKVSGTVGYSAQALAYGRPLSPKRLFVLNPLSTSWDVAPFSFCVDWILDISSLLKATQIGLTVETLAGCIGTLVTMDLSGTYSPRLEGISNWAGIGHHLDSIVMDGTFRCKMTTISRIPRAPGASLPISLTLENLLQHIPEQIALLTQITHKR